MSSNYILARSKDEEILKKAAVGGAVTGILQYLLDNNIIDGVLTLNLKMISMMEFQLLQQPVKNY